MRSGSLPMLTEEAAKYTVLEKMPGDSWEPDEFPAKKALYRQLGRFIGYNHTLAFSRCGRLPSPEVPAGI